MARVRLGKIRLTRPIWDITTAKLPAIKKPPIWRYARRVTRVSELPTLEMPIIKHIWDITTAKIMAIKIRDKLPRLGFMCSDRTEEIPPINTSRTERVPIFDEGDVIERTIGTLRELK